ncbi:hypothetical protein C8R45DRAFT_945897 [Mycena sanguinolenta]|nr:hypothetical protein C8R45DRAFT_945897 [Mycena sanguinolenta]
MDKILQPDSRTLQKVYTYIQAQQDGNKIKQLFHYIEMNDLVKDCYAELNEAKQIVEIPEEMKGAAETNHKELLELISTMPETSTAKDSLSRFTWLQRIEKQIEGQFQKIFYGRERELKDIMKMLSQEEPRIAMLGGGGMGKTSLARIALHHPDTLIRFEQGFSVSAEPANTSIELAALIALHIGLNPGKDLTKPVVQYFAKHSPCLCILNNMETVWEPIQSCSEVEEFLSLLSDLQPVVFYLAVPQPRMIDLAALPKPNVDQSGDSDSGNA